MLCFLTNEYTPQTQVNNNTAGHQIRIVINNQDIYLLPSKSYLKFKGQIKWADNDAALAADAEVTVINNALMYLFAEIKWMNEWMNNILLFHRNHIINIATL